VVAGIETSDDGRATFVAVKQHGWHKLGTLSDKPLSVAEGLDLAHLSGLEYHTEPIAVPVGDPPEFIMAPGYRAVVRRNPFNHDEWQVLGAGMKATYTVHSPEEAFAFGEDIIQQGKPLAALGSIAGGRRAFAAFHADDITIGGKDQIRMFLNVMTAFDGSMATVVRVSGIRVECQNTFHMVMGEHSAPTYRVRHTGEGLEGRLDDAMASLDVGFKGMEMFQAEADALIAREVSDAEFAKIVEQFVPTSKDSSDTAKVKAAEQRAAITKVYDGPTVAGIRGTGWGALNAYTEWADWTGGQFRSEESRMVAQITPGSVIDVRRARAAQIVGKAVGLTKTR